MVALIVMVLLIIIAGWLDARLNWADAARKEQRS